MKYVFEFDPYYYSVVVTKPPSNDNYEIADIFCELPEDDDWEVVVTELEYFKEVDECLPVCSYEFKKIKDKIKVTCKTFDHSFYEEDDPTGRVLIDIDTSTFTESWEETFPGNTFLKFFKKTQ